MGEDVAEGFDGGELGVTGSVERGIWVGIGDGVSKLFSRMSRIERRRRGWDCTAVGGKLDCRVDTFAAGGG